MGNEQVEVHNVTLTERPRNVRGFVWELRFVPQAADTLVRVREAWSVIAAWGRWTDEAEGPDDAFLVSQLPAWLCDGLAAGDVNIADWLDSIHDRDWIWLSANSTESDVVIHLLSNSLPLSTWSLRAVIEAAGGKIVEDDLARK